jgi:hypothetical protein
VHFVAPLSQQDDFYVAEASALHIWRQLPVLPLQNVYNKHSSQVCNGYSVAGGKRKKSIYQKDEISATTSQINEPNKIIANGDKSFAVESAPQRSSAVSKNGFNDDEQFKKPTRILRRGRGSHNGAKPNCSERDEMPTKRSGMLTDRRSLSSTLLMPLWAVKNALLNKVTPPAPRSLSEMPQSTKMCKVAGSQGQGYLNDIIEQPLLEEGELSSGDESLPTMTSLRQQLRNRPCKAAVVAVASGKKKFVPLAAHQRQLCCVEN